MGILKDALWDWLEDTGYDLGYDWDNYPDIEDWGDIKLNKITARTYYENINSNSNKRTRK